MRILSLAFVAFFSLNFASQSVADDWPQWMGPQRDGVWREQGITTELSSRTPIKWEAKVGGGYAGAAVANGRVFLMDYIKEDGSLANNPGQRTKLQGTERVLCFDAESGDSLWTYEYKQPYAISYAVGPRATPAVAGGTVYCLGAEGKLTALDVETGEMQWEKDLQKEYSVASPIWGFAAHPLIDSNNVITMVGGNGTGVVAFDRETGKERWRALSCRDAGYCPAQIIEFGGQRQLIAWTPKELASLNPETGKVLWRKTLEPDYGMSIAMPRRAGNLLFATGYAKSAVYELSAAEPAATEKWNTPGPKSLYCSNSTPMIDEGLAYGCDINSGTLKAISLSDGSEVWSTTDGVGGDRRRRHATAFLTKIVGQDRFILWNDKGDLILCTLDPKGYTELSKRHVLEPTQEAFGAKVVWTPPAYANRTAFVRNDKKLVAVDLSE